MKLPFQLEEEINELVIFASSIENKPFIILYDVMEGRIYEECLNTILDEIRNMLRSRGVEYIFVFDGDFVQYSQVINHSDIIYSNFLLLTGYIYTVLEKSQETNRSWNNVATKGLYMPGKPDRPHRAKLMGKLWEQNKLNKLEWSFSMTNVEESNLRKHYLDYPDDKFQQFKKDCIKNLDLYPTSGNDDTFTYNGYPYDHQLYENTSFSVISESDFSANLNGVFEWFPKLTEKTYRTIVNRHPFICSWYPGMVDHIESLGFKSFKEYQMNPNYNNIQNLDKRIDATVHNISFFNIAANKPNVVNKIREDVEYNYHHFMNLASKEFEKIKWILDLPQNLDRSDSMNLHKFVAFIFPIVFADRNWEPNWLT